MLETPIDVPYVWLGVATVSVLLAGVAADLPVGTPPDAVGPANTVDRVAASSHPAVARHPIDAQAVRIGPRRLGVRGEGGTAHSTFAFGPVTPAPEGPLQAILRGTPPGELFETPEAFRRAAARARNRTPTWRTVEDGIVVRSVSWGGIDVTLVGA